MASSNQFRYIIQGTGTPYDFPSAISMTLKDMFKSTVIKWQNKMQQRANGSQLPGAPLTDFNRSIYDK